MVERVLFQVMRVFVQVALVLLAVGVESHDISYGCSGGEDWKYDRLTYRCYKRMNDINSPVTHQEAFEMCIERVPDEPPSSMADCNQSNKNKVAYLARTRLAITARLNGPGFWCPYKRAEDAPENKDDFKTIRKNKQLYKKVYRDVNGNMASSTISTEDRFYWRGPDESKWPPELEQPGDKEDDRDEQCATIKNMNRGYDGLDSYHCSLYMKHHAVCAKFPIGQYFLKIASS